MSEIDSVPLALGKRVRKIRKCMGMTQENLAELAQLDPTYISGIECGKRNPGIKNVARLAKSLGVSMSNLLKGVNS